MTTTKARTQKPLKNRQTEIRALLRHKKRVTVAEVADAIGISPPYAYKLLAGLIKRKEVYIPYAEETGVGGIPRNVYCLTESYLKALDQAAAKARKPDTQSHWKVKHFEPPKPWYKRALGWLTGNSEARA